MSAIASPSTFGPTAAVLRLAGRLSTRLGIVLLFCVSGSLLMHLGYAYMAAGGNILTKIHPSTYVLTAAVAALLLSEGLSRPLAETAIRHPGVVAQCFGFVMLAYSCILVQRYPASQIVDTFFTGLLAFLLVSRIGTRDRDWLGGFLHALFVVNAAIGLVEMVTPFRLVPTYLGDELVTFEWRSTALLGHPLSNAALTGVYVLLLTGPAGRVFPLPVRLGLFGLQMAAMTAFGGRTALIVLIGFLMLRAGIHALGILRGRSFSRTATMLAILFATSAVVGAVIAVEAGLLDRFIGRFVEDNGSAGARSAMLRVFEHIDPVYVLFGPEPWLIRAAQHRLGIPVAIESFIVGFVALYGLLVTVFFFTTLAAFLLEVVRFSGRGAIAPLAYFLVVAAGANSISAKATDLTMTIVLCMVLCTAFPGRRPITDR